MSRDRQRDLLRYDEVRCVVCESRYIFGQIRMSFTSTAVR